MIEKTIRRFGLLLTLALVGLMITGAATKDAQARTHRHGRYRIRQHAHSVHGKIRHNAYSSRRMSNHLRYARAGYGKHSARLSRHHQIPQRALTSEEKTEIVQKIREVAESTPAAGEPSVSNAAITPSVSRDDSLVAAQKNSADIQAQIAEAAKEEEAEDGVDASLDQYFKSRPGATNSAAMQAALDPASDAERQPDITLIDETDPTHAAQRSDVMAEIINWIGTRYVFGGIDRSGIDCSAFTRDVFEKSLGIDLPRTAYEQSQLGDPVSKDNLQFGDLVFFKTAGYAPITHVGIYIGEGLFANAACSRGVTVASLESEYWAKHFVEARRLVSNSGMASLGTSGTNGAMAVGQ